MAFIINIETATKVCSVSLGQNGELIDSIESKEGNSHAVNLAPFIDELLKRNNMEYSQLSAIAISEGPGSYTGLRIGTSTAKGLCYALDIPLIAVSTLHSIAVNAKRLYDKEFDGIIMPMIDARRMEVYTQYFNKELTALNEVNALIVEDNDSIDLLNENKIIFCGDGAGKFKEVINHQNAIFFEGVQATSLGMVGLSFEMYKNEKFVDVAYFEPFYLKEFVAAVSKVKGLK